MDLDFRYYMGRHKVLVVGKGNKHYAIKHLEAGYVGNKRVGYKKVKIGDYDITVPRLLRKKRKEG